MGAVEGKKQEKRRALMQAAYELFLERGTDKTSIEQIPPAGPRLPKGPFTCILRIKGC